MLVAIMKIRTVIHATFGGFEHLCAVAIALNEYKFGIGRALVSVGSIGLLVFSGLLIIDGIITHVAKVKSVAEKVKPAGYRKLPVI